ncbi:GNAT family N-acetyltransferase [Herbaspirillum rhizosphaerae]|uniref:GNAT family N-acetyltransferase n=1 Tax=Herbaspirillum rhizosphaerae TaxID=346179 RepID=UPI0009F92BE4|nr:GNAT family N-acetyltransferase [Herbaspirillum rhizosphaerae]
MNAEVHYRTRIISSLAEIGQSQWDALVAAQPDATPFLSYAFLHALHESGSAAKEAGWEPQYLTLWQDDQLKAALPLYLKYHSYGEYVFDWAWAEAYERHGLPYYPKLLSAIPFTPVTGGRLLAHDDTARQALVQALGELQSAAETSSTHILYPPEAEARTLAQAGFMLRSGVQFHWHNEGYRDFGEFLSTLERKKRKNILAERRKVAEAGVSFRHLDGAEATEKDWRFFHRCYRHTYSAHYSTPYLNLDFFLRIAADMPQHLLLTVAYRDGKPIASSLVVHDAHSLYGRYWGALEEVPCLHFETAYYQPLEFCIANKIAWFEGGAQGEHKMARGFLPQKTWSAHWLAHPSFADAVERFLEREGGGINDYLSELNERNPFRTSSPT